MSKVATKIELVAAEAIWQFYVKKHLEANPTHTTKYLKNTPNGQIFNHEGKLVLNYTKFRQILIAHNKKVGEKIVKGYAYDLGAGLGDLYVARVERPTNSKALNKAESLKLHAKLKAAGTLTKENWKVFYTDDDFIMLVWHKGNGRLRNIHLYKFKTAGGQPGKGFRQSISIAVKTNPTLKAQYPFIPTKSLVYAN